MSNFERCPACNGTLRILGLGMIEKECPTCDGIGYVDCEKNHDQENTKENTTHYAEQDIFENTQNEEAAITLDQSTRNSSPGDRQDERGSAVAAGESYLPGTAESQQDNQEIGRKKGKSKQSREEV